MPRCERRRRWVARRVFGDRSAQRGFTYLFVLAATAALCIGLSAVGTAWSQIEQRDREAQLLRIGDLYIVALASYRDASPGTDKQYPASLDDLLLDRRQLGLKRHLRAAYTDPMQPGHPLGLVRDAAGRIHGVFSTSAEPPLSRVPVATPGQPLPAQASSYADWKFIVTEPS